MNTIFIVDDSDTNLSMAESALEDQYRVLTMASGAKMFSLLEKMIPDLILLDIEMPEMNGIDALIKLKSYETWKNIPVIFLTGRTDETIEVHCFELGAVDFITKPFSAPVLLKRVKTHLDIDKAIRERSVQISRLQYSIVSVLANVVENRDKINSGHIERTSEYIKILINEMKKRGVYAEETADWDVDKMILSSRMHDLGKISVTDLIMNKPGKLTNDEYEIMKTHVTEGERIIDEIIVQTGEGDYLLNAKKFAGYHHERWDGKGYPYGLKGTDIPLQGRIMAIVDVYDAITSKRPYKRAFTSEEAVQIIMENAGTHYDPEIANIFYEVKDLFKAVKSGV
ncbi:MAG: response regulator [Treponema sp.]|jgi:putative two-component system response regulator|nr:response regulator [Treponema sp.]